MDMVTTSQIGEDIFEALFDSSPQSSATRKDQETCPWAKYQALAEQCSVSHEQILRQTPLLVQKAIIAVRRAVMALLAAPKPPESVEQLGKHLYSEYGWVTLMRSTRPCMDDGSHKNVPGAKQGAGKKSLYGVRHSFLLCHPLPGVEVVIEPLFRKCFQLGQSSVHYRSFLAATVPEVFVGTMSLMAPVAAGVLSAVAIAFAELGMPLPPWRNPANVMTRWLSGSLVDTMCGGPSARAGGAPDPSPTTSHHQQGPPHRQRLPAAADKLHPTTDLLASSPSSPSRTCLDASTEPTKLVVGFEVLLPPTGGTPQHQVLALHQRYQAVPSQYDLPRRSSLFSNDGGLPQSSPLDQQYPCLMSRTESAASDNGSSSSGAVDFYHSCFSSSVGPAVTTDSGNFSG